MPQRDLPELWLMVAARLGISLVFVLAAIFEPLRDQLHFVVLVTVGAIGLLIIQSNQEQTRKLRNLAALDLMLMLTVVPITVLNAFVAAEPGELLPAEQSALLQTWLALVFLLFVGIVIAFWLFPGDRIMVAAGLLPGLVAVVSVMFVLHDYRNETVVAMLAVSYFIGAAAISLGSFVEEPVARYLPAVFYVSTVFAGVVLFDPGLGNLFDRESLVQVLSWIMILLGLAFLLLLANPYLDPRRMMNSGVRARDERQRSERTYDDDSARISQERS